MYVVDSNNSVHVRDVKTASSQSGNIVIEDGLSVGETVVIDGLDKLKDKMKVIPVKKDAPSQQGHKNKFNKEQ